MEWIDRAAELVAPVAGTVTIRGDTDFTHTAQLDRWDGRAAIHSGDGCSSQGGQLGRSPAEEAWQPWSGSHVRDSQPPTRKRVRQREQIVQGYENNRLVGEDIAEIEYQPVKCQRKYRLVIVRKNISVQKGEQALFDEIRYFFYITNRGDKAPERSWVWPTGGATRRM